MEYITAAKDNIIEASVDHVTYANQEVDRIAKRLGVAETELESPPRAVVKKLATCFALREEYASAVGGDPLVQFEGSRSDDIFLQKYNLYSGMIKEIISSLSYEDFVKEGTDDDGKGGIGMIRLSRC